MPKKNGCINGVAVLTRFLNKKMYGSFCQVAKKVVVTTRLLYYYTVIQAGFHCK